MRAQSFLRFVRERIIEIRNACGRNWGGPIRTASFFCGAILLFSVLRPSPGLAEDAQPAPSTATLRGRILNDDATGVTNATVTIYRAHPKRGSSVTCPSCFPDCNKSARTDGDGVFLIEGLDPSLQFELLVTAPGYETHVFSRADPAKKRTEYSLPFIDPDLYKMPSRLNGVVLDFEGRPIPGAALNCEGIERGNGTSWGGNNQDVPAMIVSDGAGRFISRCSPQVTLVHARVEARGAAPDWVELKPGRDMIVRLREGVTVSGRLSAGGAPLTNAVVGLTTREREMGKYFSGFDVSTTADGRFEIKNLPADRDYVFYVRLETMSGRGAFKGRQVHAGANGTSVDLGAMAAERGYNIKGKVVVANGAALPEALYFSRDDIGDGRKIELDEEGRFEIRDLPQGPVVFNVNGRGVKFSKNNRSLDWYNGRIVGTVDRDIPDLILAVESGEWRWNQEQNEAPAGTNMQPTSEPLQSAKIN
jgi:hypothetical protein